MLYLQQIDKMIHQKPLLEKIAPTFGSSFTLQKFESSNPNTSPFWHFHPELEIVYIKEGSGKRHIGNHISYFNQGDLIMIGPNLPHLGFSNRLGGQEREVVVQMREDFLGETFFDIPEMREIKSLFERSKAGLRFYGNTKEEIGNRLNDLFYMNSFEKVTSFLTILQMLANSNEYKTLNAGGIALVVQNQDNDRIDNIYAYVRKHFQSPITLEEIAREVNMTVPAFCRYFKKLTKKTFIQFVNEFRIVHACKLISEQRMTITEICYESGFNNFSHFTKYFKKITGKSPSEYRKSLNQVVAY